MDRGVGAPARCRFLDVEQTAEFGFALPQATEAEAGLYQEWITNDRTLRALIAEMRQIAAHATELIMQDADDQRAGV